MSAVHVLLTIVSILAAIFVPQALAIFYAAPRNPEIGQHEFDCR